MNKNILLLASGGMVLTFNGFAAKTADKSVKPVKPNILWVMSEDQSQDLGCYGMKGVKTPVLDRMASEGIRYDNAFCTNPISSPSRSAMMTGVHQEIIGAHNHRSNRDVPLPAGIRPITYYLRQQGYTCILGNSQVMARGRKTDCNFKYTPIGAWNDKDQLGLFDKYDEFTPQDQPFFAQIQLLVTHRGDWWKKVRAESPHPVDPDSVQLPPYMPDHPKVREEWACYLDMTERMDYEMGLILQQLKEKGMYDNTVIFFIADNGRCDVKGKGYLYEPGILIPMIAWGPGIRPAVVKEIVSTLDISATIIALSGSPLPDCLSGKPLFDADMKPVKEHADYFYAARDNWDEVVECIRAVATLQFKYIRNYVPQVGWDRHQEYLDFHRPAIHIMRKLKDEGKLCWQGMLFMADTKPVEELYDRINDPFELKNLATDPAYQSVLQQMRDKMAEWQKQHTDMGLADKDSRKTYFRTSVRDWVIEKHPQEWIQLMNGEICDSYGKWVKEVEQAYGSRTGDGL